MVVDAALRKTEVLYSSYIFFKILLKLEADLYFLFSALALFPAFCSYWNVFVILNDSQQMYFLTELISSCEMLLS